jgi:hypothetical protein
MFAISHSTDAIAKSPGFPKSKVEEVKTLTRKAGVRTFYLLVAERSYPECKKLIMWNSAAKRVHSAGRPPDYCVLEVGVNGLAGVNESFRAIGIAEGFEDTVLYESWPEGLVTPGTGDEKRETLLWERWVGDEVAKATVNRKP